MSKVLDACAVIACLNNEHGAEKVEQLVDSGSAIISIVNVVEVYEYVYKKHGEEAAKDTLDWIYNKMDVRCVNDKEVASTAGELCGFLDVYIGDAFCAALADYLKVPVFTKDNHFKTIGEHNYCKVELF